MARYRYCPLCATPLIIRQIGHRQYDACPECGFVNWNNSKPCTGGLVMQYGKLLLIRRGIEPFKGYWDIPGGFLESGEEPEAGTRRELLEETGLVIEINGLLDIIVDVYGDPAQAGNLDTDLDYTLNIFYLAVPVGGMLKPADDAAEAHWFALDALPPDDQIAFENGKRALKALRLYLAC